MSLVFLENCLYKKAYCHFCQLTLLNISLSVETAIGFQCNLLSSWQSNSKHDDDCN